MEPMKLPEHFHILYQRLAKQYDEEMDRWLFKRFYIRATKGKRDYGTLNKFDNLLLLGIFNCETGHYFEWAYNDADQEALFLWVFSNFVKLAERKRLVKKLCDFIQNQLNHTLKL